MNTDNGTYCIHRNVHVKDFPKIRMFPKREIKDIDEIYPNVVCKLVAEEWGQSEVLDSILSVGLCGMIGASSCRGSCDGT